MLLICGYQEVPKSWYVMEQKASIYSRIYYVKKGDVVYESNTEKKKLEPDTLYCFPNKIPYQMYQNRQDRLKCLYLHVDIAPYVISQLREVHPAEHPIILNLLEAFTESCRQCEGESMSMLQESLTKSIIEYLKLLGVFETVEEKISQSVLYMMENVDKKISVQELSEVSGYHPQYYIRLFRSCMGMTPHQFLIQYRMKKALSLLSQGLPVYEAAEAAGYNESKNFTREFKKTYGILPRQVKSYIFY